MTGDETTTTNDFDNNSLGSAHMFSTDDMSNFLEDVDWVGRLQPMFNVPCAFVLHALVLPLMMAWISVANTCRDTGGMGLILSKG